MNRQEAIRILKKELEITKDIDKRFGDFPEHREALEIAISSLETDEAYQLEYEQPEFCADCISREAVKYYIQAHIQEIITESGIDKNAHTNRVLRALLDGVNTMPSATPQEPKTGHWIPTGYYGYADGNPVWEIWECSECGYEHNGEEDTLTAYCPDCGANMVELQESEEIINKYTKEQEDGNVD